MLVHVESLKKLILQAECVTFDVFDTLLVRDLILNPTDVFYFLARDQGLNHKDATNFKLERIKNEELQRELSKLNESTTEIHISDIYRGLVKRYQISFQDEINFEKRILKPRPLIAEIYRYAKDCGKKVFAVSDIYLNSGELTEILSGHNLTFDGVYTSCEAGYGKYEVKLFEKLISDHYLNPKTVVHIGDNSHADYISAMKSGITAVLIEKQTSELFVDSYFNLSCIHQMRLSNDAGHYFYGSLIAYIAKHRETEKCFSATQLFGIMYATPLLYHFCKWLSQKATADKVNKLFLMARDGYAISNVFSKIGSDVEFEVLNISRRAVLFPAASIDKSIWEKFFTAATDKKILDILSDLELERADEITALLPNGGNESFFSLSSNVQVEFIRNSYLIAFAQMQRECIDYKKYATNIGLTASDVAVVDVGWALSSHKALELILNKKIRGYYVGKLKNAYSHDSICAYLFDSLDDEDAAWRPIFEIGVELLELPFISKEEQVVRIIGDTFIRKENYVANRLRANIAAEISSEVSLFLDAIEEFDYEDSNQDDKKKCLLNIFRSLILSPTSNEFYKLGSIPHDRYVAGSGTETVGVYWRLIGQPVKSNLGAALSVVYKSLKLYGFRITFLKILKKFAI